MLCTVHRWDPCCAPRVHAASGAKAGARSFLWGVCGCVVCGGVDPLLDPHSSGLVQLLSLLLRHPPALKSSPRAVPPFHSSTTLPMSDLHCCFCTPCQLVRWWLVCGCVCSVAFVDVRSHMLQRGWVQMLPPCSLGTMPATAPTQKRVSVAELPALTVDCQPWQHPCSWVALLQCVQEDCGGWVGWYQGVGLTPRHRVLLPGMQFALSCMPRLQL